ncbi:MAG: heparan-alpha-glucosaminide N-acetyltransferase domain-containing protein, partial [bacterium]|nr:heparan-alpha-glucosaminide N-acetyltransferase domain-containing protein [bacterium]
VNQPNRLISLDMFRGFTIALMILVNNPGSWKYVYPPLLHAEWHGWTPTDLVFPFFLFIVGVAMSLSFSRRLEAGDVFSNLFTKVLRRTLIIFALGLLLSLFPRFDFANMRIPGVLQRIAVCYFFASLIVLQANKKRQYGWTAILLAVYWILIKMVPVPGYGAGVLEPMGNLAWYIDNKLLAGHTWSGAPAPGFDPEGIFSTIPAIATVMFGVFVGDWIRTPRDQYEKVAGLFVAGNIGLVAGIIMDIWLPINKNLWTSSYAVFMSGMATVFLAMCYWLIDVKGFTGWTKPFVVFGSNAIVVYTLSGLIAKATIYIKWQSADGSSIALKSWLYQNVFQSWAGDYFGSLLYPILFNLIFLGLMWILYSKKIFIKI